MATQNKTKYTDVTNMRSISDLLLDRPIKVIGKVIGRVDQTNKSGALFLKTDHFEVTAVSDKNISSFKIGQTVTVKGTYQGKGERGIIIDEIS
jgi:hypothetical protein